MINQTKTIFETLESRADFSMFTDIVKTAGLSERLGDKDKITLFAPNNEGMAKLREEVFAQLIDSECRDRLIEVLLYHILADRSVVLNELVDRDVMHMASGDTLMVNFAHSNQLVFAKGTATMEETDILASNGVIHTINKLMIPK